LKTEHNKASILQVFLSLALENFNEIVTKKKRDKLIDILVQRSPARRKKHHDKSNEAREGRKSQVVRPSVRSSVCPLRAGKRNPGIITALIPSHVPKLIAVAETTVTF
jgi:hypothetical protein